MTEKNLVIVKSTPAFLIGVLVSVICMLPGFAWAADGDAPPNADSSVNMKEDSVPLETREQRLSYALGMVLGKQFRDQAVEIDQELYLEGLNDGLSGYKTRLSETEAHNAVKLLQSELSRQQYTTKPTEIPLSDIKVFFKLDPRLTRGMYMGDRWVSPPTFTIVQNATQAIVETKVHGVNSKGSSLKIQPEWIPEDPEMLTVTPGKGDEFSILVHKAGQSRLLVKASGISKQITLKATPAGESIRVEIMQ